MARTRSMTRNGNHDDEEASSREKRPKSYAPWSDLDNDVLYIVMMQLGFVEFVSLSGVCKSWRSFALSNRDTFMASTPPMSVSIVSNKKACYLEDFEGRLFKTILPHLTGGKCIGLTCGYMVFFMRETREFRLVNPITRHQLHFPDFPADDNYHPDKAILVFSASISEWVFVVLFKYSYRIWYWIAGERAWNHVSHTGCIRNSYAFKGKIDANSYSFRLLELRLDGSQPILKPLEIKKPDCASSNELVSSAENFYGIGWDQDYRIRLYELDLGEMKWVVVPCEETAKEYAFFRSKVNGDVVAVKRDSWADPRSRSHGRYAYTHNKWNIGFITPAKMWYFPHECMNVDLIDE